LSSEYKEILKDAENIKASFNEQPRILNYMWTVIADLYGDAAKIKGRQNVTESLKQLRAILNNYDYDQLQTFFA